MANNTQKIGWIGMGRMGFPMAERLLKAGYDVSIWNRTRAKAEPLAAKGGKIVDKLVRSRRPRRGVLHRLDRQGPERGLFRQGRRVTGGNGKLPKIFVDCSTIAVEESAESASSSRRAAPISSPRRSAATPR